MHSLTITMPPHPLGFKKKNHFLQSSIKTACLSGSATLRYLPQLYTSFHFFTPLLYYTLELWAFGRPPAPEWRSAQRSTGTTAAGYPDR